MDKDILSMYRRIGKCVEDCGRMLASNKKNYWSLEETRQLENAITDCAESLKIINEIRFSRMS